MESKSLFGILWDFVKSLWGWFSARKKEQQAEREQLNEQTETKVQEDIQKVDEQHKEKQDEINDLKTGDDIADSFNKL
jgi:cell division protein FtsB